MIYSWCQSESWNYCIWLGVWTSTRPPQEIISNKCPTIMPWGNMLVWKSLEKRSRVHGVIAPTRSTVRHKGCSKLQYHKFSPGRLDSFAGDGSRDVGFLINPIIIQLETIDTDSIQCKSGTGYSTPNLSITVFLVLENFFGNRTAQTLKLESQHMDKNLGFHLRGIRWLPRRKATAPQFKLERTLHKLEQDEVWNETDKTLESILETRIMESGHFSVRW